MLVGMRSERITVTLPKELTDEVRKAVANGDAKSVSGFVADVLIERFREENVEQFLADLAEIGEPVDDEARAWAEEIVELTRRESGPK